MVKIWTPAKRGGEQNPDAIAGRRRTGEYGAPRLSNGSHQQILQCPYGRTSYWLPFEAAEASLEHGNTRKQRRSQHPQTLDASVPRGGVARDLWARSLSDHCAYLSAGVSFPCSEDIGAEWEAKNG